MQSERRLSDTEKRIRNEYNDRLTGDLPRFLGLPFQAILIWLAARFPLDIDGHQTNKHYPAVDNADAFVVQATGIISSLFGYLMGKIAIAIGLKYPKRKPFNPAYRTFKTFSVFLQMVGTLVTVPIFFVEKASQRLIMGFSSVLIGLLGGVASLVLLLEEKFIHWIAGEKNTLFKLGHDGAAKFFRSFMYWGACIGGMFAPLFYSPEGTIGTFTFNNLNTAVMYSGAVGGVAVSLLSLVTIYTVNYFFKDKGKPILGFYGETEDEISKERDRYRDNYFRSGIVSLAGIGSVIFFIGANWLGYPSVDLMGYTALGGCVFGAVGGVGFALGGSRITEWIHNRRVDGPLVDNTWDYALQNTSTLGGYLGTACGTLAGLLLPFPIPGGDLAAMACYSLFLKAAGNTVGLAVGYQWIYSREVPDSDRLPWTQRMLLSANKNGIFGAAGGLGVGLLVYLVDPGLNLFTVMAASVSIGSSAVAFIAGALDARDNKIPQLKSHRHGFSVIDISNRVPVSAQDKQSQKSALLIANQPHSGSQSLPATPSASSGSVPMSSRVRANSFSNGVNGHSHYGSQSSALHKHNAAVPKGSSNDRNGYHPSANSSSLLSKDDQKYKSIRL